MKLILYMGIQQLSFMSIKVIFIPLLTNAISRNLISKLYPQKFIEEKTLEDLSYSTQDKYEKVAARLIKFFGKEKDIRDFTTNYFSFMKLAIMQPYLFPYIGYFQLINSVDKFVIYDDVEYSKGGWINRNRLYLDNKATFFTVPIKRSSDFCLIKDKKLKNLYYQFAIILLEH